MNWNLFFGGLTWSITIVSLLGFIATVTGSSAVKDSQTDAWFLMLASFLVITLFGIAVISGMRWWG
jgi:hypothetical protein